MKNNRFKNWLFVLSLMLVAAVPALARGVDKDELDDEGRGIIEDYDDMDEGDDINWVWVKKGIELQDYKIDVGEFENMSGKNDDDMEDALNDGFRKAFAKLSKRDGRKGTLTTQNAIYWAERANNAKRWIPYAGSHLAQAGVGIEMVFRDSKGEIVAKIRHSAREGDDLEDAAEELVDDIVDWVQDN